MFGFILRRLGLLIPTFIGVSLVAFFFIRLLPGDPVLLLAGERGISPERYAELMHRFGFDLPLWKQFIYYFTDLLHGDFGTSISTKKPIFTEFFTLFPATLELSFCAVIFAVALDGRGVEDTFRALLASLYRRHADDLGLAAEHGLDEAAFIAGGLGRA